MKQLLKQFIHRIGYDVTRWKPDEPHRGFTAWHLASICQPRTVFDVGVGRGTDALYAAFPRATFVLVEPLQEYASVIEDLKTRLDCIAVAKAVGSTEGAVTIHVDIDDPEKSSFLTRSSLTARGHQVEHRTVEITTLDRIVSENPGLEEPFFLKLDTEGHELEALRGATSLLKRTEYVLAETSLVERFEGGYHFEDMIEFMKTSGFRVSDVLAVAAGPQDLEPHHMDVLFRRL